MQRVTNNMRAALAYADRLGWHVIPQRGKFPLTKHGVHDASKDAGQIERWWTAYPQANIGVATGKSGIVALDFDGPEGIASLRNLDIGLATPRQNSGGGGVHIIVAEDERFRARQRVLPGVDVRARDSLVTVSPSIHPETGAVYEWDKDMHPLKVAVAPMPERLFETLAPPERAIEYTAEPAHDLSTYGKGALESACKRIAGAVVGLQERTLSGEAFSIGRIVGAGVIPEGVAISHLISAGTRMSNEKDRRPWGMNEIESKVRRGVSCGSRNPRQMAERER